MIKVLHKVDRILETVARCEGIQPSEIGRRLGLNKATLSHLLSTLEALGYVRRVGRAVHIGWRLRELAGAGERQRLLLALAERCARSLSERLRELVTISQLIDGERYNLAKAEYAQAVRVHAALEQRPSPYETATGRVLLAFTDERLVADVVARKGLPGDAWPEAHEEASLRALLAGIRSAGRAEMLSAAGDVYTVALPVRDPQSGALVASVGVGVPAYRYDAAARQRLIAEVGRTVAEFEDGLRA